MPAKLLDFPELSLLEVTKRLRKLADQIEEGKVDRPETLVMVSCTEYGDIQIFGFGEADPHRAYYLMAKAMRQMDG